MGRLRSARRVVVVGNGGIALELIHEVYFVLIFSVYDPIFTSLISKIY